MRLYVTPLGRWAGTQAEAKALGREDHAWLVVDVPTEKAGLLTFLNEHRVGAMALPRKAALPSVPDDAALYDDTVPLSVDAIAEWVLNTATQAQVETLFSQIGARWGEARR